jgi:hypothetical protein
MISGFPLTFILSRKGRGNQSKTNRGCLRLIPSPLEGEGKAGSIRNRLLLSLSGGLP